MKIRDIRIADVAAAKNWRVLDGWVSDRLLDMEPRRSLRSSAAAERPIVHGRRFTRDARRRLRPVAPSADSPTVSVGSRWSSTLGLVNDVALSPRSAGPATAPHA